MSVCCAAAEARHDQAGNCGRAPRTLISTTPPRRKTMPQMIFVNLPVADLDKSKAFYEAVGAVNNPAFTDEPAACMVVEEGSIHVMLLTHEHWPPFTSTTIPDARTHPQVLPCEPAASTEDADRPGDKAVPAGGPAPPAPAHN